MTRITTVLFALIVTAAACEKPIAPDARLDDDGRFKIGYWPLRSTTFAAGVAEVEAKIGPGRKLADGSMEWTGIKTADTCARISLRDDGGKLSQSSEQMRAQHPEFKACAQTARASAVAPK